MTDEYITSDSLPEGSDGAEAVSEGEGTEGLDRLSLEDLNSTLGKDFPTKEAALKSIKDTYSYVGKKVEAPRADNSLEGIDPNKFISREEFEAETFFSKNQELEPYKKIINKLREPGQSLNDVVNSDDFKNIYEKASAFEKMESSKSVLQSNPRLGKVMDLDKEAKVLSEEASQKSLAGDHFGAVKAIEHAGDKAVQSVIKAYGLDE